MVGGVTKEGALKLSLSLSPLFLCLSLSHTLKDTLGCIKHPSGTHTAHAPHAPSNSGKEAVCSVNRCQSNMGAYKYASVLSAPYAASFAFLKTLTVDQNNSNVAHAPLITDPQSSTDMKITRASFRLLFFFLFIYFFMLDVIQSHFVLF